MPFSFENYDEKACTYTALRRTPGARQIAHFICKGAESLEAKSKRAKTTDADLLSSMTLLDSGCGTGNYTVDFVREFGLRRVHCTDYNDAMVGEAKKNIEKLIAGTSDSDITYSSDNVCDMPSIPTAAFDAVINNQVVHHLRPDNDFADLKNACKEWFRVLKPGGRLSINFSQPFQQRTAMWWAELIPQAQATWEKRAVPVEVMRRALVEAGFEGDNVEFHHLHDEILYDPKVYNDLVGFHRDPTSVTRSDSTWNLSTEAEIALAVAKVGKMIEDGTLEQWRERKEQERKQIGQSTCAWAVKKA